MKKLIIVALLSIQVQIVFAQCISVELSVTWEAGYDIFEKDSMIHIPKLHIIYRNNCNTNYYFLKISENRDGLGYDIYWWLHYLLIAIPVVILTFKYFKKTTGIKRL